MPVRTIGIQFNAAPELTFAHSPISVVERGDIAESDVTFGQRLIQL